MSDWEEIPLAGSDDSDWEEVDNSELLKPEEPKVSGRGGAQTALEHFGKGASFGYLPQLQAGAETAVNKAGDLKDKILDIVGLDKLASIEHQLRKEGFRLPDETYLSARDANIKRLEEQAKAHPKTAKALEVAGGVSSGIAMTPLMGGQAATSGARMLNAAKTGAAIGTLSNPGDTEGEISPVQLKERAVNGVIGAGTGALVQGGAELIGKAAPIVSDNARKAGLYLKDKAERLAARALGAERGTVKSIGMDKLKEAGRQALDEKVLSPLASTDDLIARNAALKQKGGNMMGEAYQAVDDAGASTFNPLEVASKVDEELGGFYRSPINKGETNQLENTLESILMRGDKNLPLKDAQALKEELGKVANWKNTLNPTDKEKMAREAYSIVNRSIDDAVASGSGAIEKAGLGEKLTAGKKLYGNASTADKLLQNKSAREEGNKLLGLTDWSVLGVGAGAALPTAGASVPAAMAMTAAKKGLEKYGAQTGAIGIDKVSKMLMGTPKFADLAAKNPKAFNALAANFAKRLGGGEMSKVAGPGQKPVDEQEAREAFLNDN